MLKPRLKDIAVKAKVSPTAVSKVLNNRPIRIHEEKRQAIQRAARELKYRPNVLARCLRERATRTIGIVVPGMATLFYPELIQSITCALSVGGYKTLITDTGEDPDLERRHVEDLLNWGVDGLVIAPAKGDTNLEFLRTVYRTGLPLVLMDRYFPGEEFPYVVSDNRGGAASGVRTFFRQGRTRIFYLGEQTRNASLNDRLAGVDEEARRWGWALEGGDIYLCLPDRAQVARTADIMFDAVLADKSLPAGFFLESNRFLLGLLDSARDRGIFIPDAVRITGFDPFTPEITSDEDFRALRMLSGPISIIRQNIQGMGKSVCEYLRTFLKDKRRPEWRIQLPPILS